MPFYTQTLEDIPKEFLSHQNRKTYSSPPGSGNSLKTEDLFFILVVLLFLQDEPFFTVLE